MPEQMMTPKREHKRSYSKTMRLKICSEYLTGGSTAKKLAAKYHISRRTIQYWLDDYKSDYAGCLDVYQFIMGELAANGFRKAAEYLRDYAVDILTDFSGMKPPANLEVNFDDVLADLPETSSGDDIGDDLAVFDRFRK